MHKTETGGLPEIMISKDTLQHSMFLGIPNTDIAKLFNAGRELLAHWIKCYESHNVLRDLDDDNEIIQILSEMQQFHSNAGFRCVVGHLRAK